MKKIVQYFLLLMILSGTAACSKKYNGPPATAVAEANLSISLNPDPGSGISAALSDTYPFKLVINSVPPKNGVKIDITGTRERDNVVQLSQTSQTSSATITSIDLQLNGLLPGVVYIIKLTVTSLTTNSNTISTTFKVARK